MDAPIQQTNESNDISLKGVVGIQNMGNTCYCNSTIQLLRSCSELNRIFLIRNFIEEFKDTNNNQVQRSILLAYQDILKSLWSSNKPAYVRPSGFISEVRRAVNGSVYEMFGLPVPNDSHEYLVYLLDNFHEALKLTETDHIEKELPENASDSEKMVIMSENGWNIFLSKNNSDIVALFFGMLRKTIHCTFCKNNTYQWEIFNSLKIPCEGNTLYDWISQEMKDSEIEGYHCDNCEKLTPGNNKHLATTSTHIWKLPKYLFITMRRFSYDGRKNTSLCNYTGDNICLSNYFAPESIDPSRNYMYEIRGVSDHHGSHLGGHYTAQFKHPLSNEWWWFDDESSHRLDAFKCMSSNYIMLFRAINT